MWERHPAARAVSRFLPALAACGLLIVVGGCISASPAARKVRATVNLELVRGCEFLGNVRATSIRTYQYPCSWLCRHIAYNNTFVAVLEKTTKLGGNVVFLVAWGFHASGEAYRCAEVPSGPPEHIIWKLSSRSNLLSPASAFRQTGFDDAVSRTAGRKPVVISCRGLQ